ncbi:hypothetical protein JOD24_000232 [Kroppenstedtia sanguinis]
MINQKMSGGRESCAAIARPRCGSDPGETCALWVQSDLCHPTQRRIWREGV